MLGSIKSNSLASALDWYQKKLGSYDQQLWEKTVEERVLKGLSNAIPKKLARVKTELIDLDLIRGSAFTKAKPKQGCIATTCLGILRVLLFPFFLKWWTDQTNKGICGVLSVLYFLQLSSMYLYFNFDQVSDDLTPPSQQEQLKEALEDVPTSEVLIPVIMLVILSVIQSHIAASHSLDERSRNRIESDCSPRSPSNNSASTVSRSVTTGPRGYKHQVKRKKRNTPEKKSPVKDSVKKRNKQEQEKQKENTPILRSSSCASISTQGNCSSGGKCTGPMYLKKPSDEESGLEIADSEALKIENLSTSFRWSGDDSKLSIPKQTKDGRNDQPLGPSPPPPPPPAPLTHPSHPPRPRASVPVPGTGEESVATCRPRRLTTDDGGQLTGEEGDHEAEDQCTGDLSSLDEISPYSTVNSATADATWRRYSDIISHRIRSLSQSQAKRRFSGSEEPTSRLRSCTFTKSRTRFSCTQRTLDHEDLHISSNESEASLSPTTPNKANTDLDWPMINSEGTSEDDEEDEAHVTIATSDRAPPPLSSEYQSFFREEDLLCDDPDNFPPHILSFGVFETPRNVTDSRSEFVSCAIWQQNECQKVDLTVLDISSAVIRKAGKTKYSNEYLYLALAISLGLAAIPGLFRLQANGTKSSNTLPGLVFGPVNQSNLRNKSTNNVPLASSASASLLHHHHNHHHHQQGDSSGELIESLLNQIPVPEPSVIFQSLITPSSNWIVRYIVLVAIIERYCMSAFFFFLLCVAERTYRERFMFSKYFCHLTSARRARRSELPHFRLNKVRNIKTWLSVRSYLKKHGPQRSVDIIVSCSFILAVVILTVLCMQLLREEDTCSSKLYCWEMLSWNLAIGFYILRLMVLGIKMNRKYKSNLSVLITEQINLYLQLEQKPHKKDELTLANHVLKLAADLLKQLEAPFKISGFSANNYLYNITKVVVLSAFSAVLTELLGFKLKLHKIKL